MKTIIATISLLLIIPFANGQDKKVKKTAEERAELATSKLDKEVNLAKDQRDKIYAINLRTAQKAKEVRQNKTLSEEQKKETIKKSNQNRKQLILAELTDEQKKILKEKRKANKDALDEE